MTAYYNEHDPKAAAALRQLIAEGFIAPGDVDERNIEDVAPAELVGYTQRHFFAGEGIWSLALRHAGWPDGRAVVTGSCPCQPFSAAGKGAGFADERHLWPAFAWHIALGDACPVFGEQVASDDGLAWLDAVCADLEHAGYAVGPLDLCAAGFGAPHIRQRLYWMAYPEVAVGRRPGRAADRRRRFEEVGGPSHIGGLEHSDGGDASPERQQCGGQHGLLAERGGTGGLEHDAGDGREQWRSEPGGRGIAARREPSGLVYDLGEGLEGFVGDGGDGHEPGRHGTLAAGSASASGSAGGPGPTNGFWGGADWLLCRAEPGHPDGRWRPVEPGTFPLAHGYSHRVPALRLAGNSLVEPEARAFIEAGMRAIAEQELTMEASA